VRPTHGEGGWPTRKAEAAFTHLKLRKIKEQKLQDNNKTTETNKIKRILQQLKLQGVNINTGDGKAFGDWMNQKDSDTKRIISQNIGCLPAHVSHYKCQQIVNKLSHQGADAWLIQEVRMC
jgi:hypothetical protein